jgi:hypothetical protein
MPQGINEVIVYTLDTLPWGGNPSETGIIVTVYDYSERMADIDHDVTEDVMPVNNPTVDENTIILSPMQNLEEGTKYRLSIEWDSGSNHLETYCYIDGER